MRRFASHFPIFAVLALLACGSSEGPLNPTESDALSSAEVRWSRRGFTDYSYEGRIVCFCPVGLAQWAEVQVRSGRVAQVRFVEGNAPTIESPGSRPTIEELFARIREARTQDWVKDIIVTYDGRLGFPVTIDLVSKPNIADAGVAYQVRNVKGL
jgi:hypothetical protein